jgi:glycosyltransferase involved in cell wall biosynthesis
MNNTFFEYYKMKIVIVVPYLTTIGGAARYAWEFSEYLASQGDDVILVSLYTDKQLYKPKSKMRIIDLSDKKTLTQSIKFWLNLTKISKSLHNLIDQEKPDIVFFNHYPCTMWVEKYGNIPTICYPQDINLLYTNTYINNLPTKIRIPWRLIRVIIRFYDKYKWKYFDQVICHSNFTAKNIKKYYGINSKVIHLGTNTDVFSSVTNLNKKNAILSLGDTKIRRADLLIIAASKLIKKRNDFQIWIVGSKNDLDLELKNMVKHLQLENNVKFFGRISDSELANLYSQALATVHLVKEAPFGLIVLESMACGTPVISWKPGGPEETIVDGQTGFLIPENDEKELVEKIELLLDTPKIALVMGEKGILRVKTLFDLKQHHIIMRNHLLDWIQRKKK